MRIRRPSVCGSLESNDILIRLQPAERTLEIELESIVKVQFGDAIELVIRRTLEELGVEGVAVFATDKGALDCTIRARVETAVARAMDEVAS